MERRRKRLKDLDGVADLCRRADQRRVTALAERAADDAGACNAPLTAGNPDEAAPPIVEAAAVEGTPHHPNQRRRQRRLRRDAPDRYFRRRAEKRHVADRLPEARRSAAGEKLGLAEI